MTSNNNSTFAANLDAMADALSEGMGLERGGSREVPSVGSNGLGTARRSQIAPDPVPARVEAENAAWIESQGFNDVRDRVERTTEAGRKRLAARREQVGEYFSHLFSDSE